LINSKVNISYLNERRFLPMSHPNIINMLGRLDNQNFKIGEGTESIIEASCIAMEYAPYGDFCDILATYAVYNDDVLVRTFFHHLIEALKYLHERKISHLDIKLDNLLLGEDFNLKVTDFDLSHIEGDQNLMGKGTQNYRAPEIMQPQCLDTIPADIYSAGIVLYMLKTGIFPYLESKKEGVPDYLKQFKDGDVSFWNRGIEHEERVCDEQFQKLFSEMVQEDPKSRKTLKEIEENNWYKGDIYLTKDIPEALDKLYLKDIAVGMS